MIRLALGDCQATVLDAGRLWLDGGAMFGVVPRVLWEKERAPDAENRIELAMNVLLVENDGRRILIDTGAGTKAADKARRMYRLEPLSPIEILAPAGLAPEQIDIVVNTHLHFDHAGGNTVRGPSGEPRAAFPNAEYVVQAGEVDAAARPNERTRASYFAEDFDPLRREGRLRLVEGDLALTPHLRLTLAPGHTPHMQIPILATRERTLAFLADLVPTASHVPYPFIMAYDLDPLATLATKKRLLPVAAREEWILVFEHDARIPVGTLAEEGGRLRARPFFVEA